jgi:hypothetical protein
MPRKKKPPPTESSYTLRPEQETMLDLPTKAPEAVAVEELPADRLLTAIPDGARLRRIVDRYRPRKYDPNQVGFGLAFGAVNEANQDDLFRSRKPPSPPPAPEGRSSAPASAPATQRRAPRRK